VGKRVAITFPQTPRAMAWRRVADHISRFLVENGVEVRWGDVFTYISMVLFDKWISIDTADMTHMLLAYSYRWFTKNLVFYVVTEGRPYGAPFKVCPYISKIYTPSQFSKEMLKKYLNVEAEVVPHGIDPDEYANVNQTLVNNIREKYKGKILAFYPCFNDPRKNIDFTLETWAEIIWEVPEAILLLNTNPTGYWNIPALMEKLKKENPAIEKHVVLTRGEQPLPFQELLAYYHACDLLLFSSTCEGFGYPILEAYACGKPVLALDTFGVNELVRDGETGLLVKTEPPSELTAIGKHFLIRRPDREDYIKKTITMLTDEELRRKLGENAKKEVEKYHFRKVYKVFLL